MKTFSLFFLLTLICTLGTTPAYADRTAREAEAIQLGRDGHHEESIAILRDLIAENPYDESARSNLVVVLGWAGRHEEALQVGRELDLSVAPVWAIEATARAARDFQDYAYAVEVYRMAVERTDDCLTCELGLALALADQYQAAARKAEAAGEEMEAGLSEAIERIKPLVKQYPNDTEVLFGCGYIYRLRHEHFDALNCYERLLTLLPDESAGRGTYGTSSDSTGSDSTNGSTNDEPSKYDEAFRLKVITLAESGASYLASKEASRRPEALSPADHHRLAVDRAAKAVNWGQLPEGEDDGPYDATDHALALLEDNLETIPETEAEEPLRRRTRFDKVVALKNRLRREESVLEFEQLLADGVKPRPYVIRAAADAYLGLNQPARAKELFASIIDKMPDEEKAHAVKMGLFWALNDNGEHEAARDLIDQIRAEEPAWRTYPGLLWPEPNWRKVEAHRTSIMARAYADRQAYAQERMESLLAAAPFNVGVRESLAAIYSWRGWPLRALEEYELALALEPEHIYSRLGRIGVLRYLGRVKEADRELQILRAQYPEHQQVKQLWDEFKPAWEIYYVSEFGEGGGPDLGQVDSSMTTTIYMPRINLRMKPFVRHLHTYGEFPEGEATYQRLGAGLEVAFTRVTLMAVAETTLEGPGDDDSQPGITFGVDVRLTDHLTAAVNASTNSNSAPLRGRRFGLEGESVDAALAYDWNDLGGARLGFSRLDLNDGNVMTSFSLSAKHRFFNRKRHKLTGELGLWLSESSQPGGPYYSPSKDRSTSATVHWDFLGHINGFRRINHRVSGTYSDYWQEGFGSSPNYIVEYRQTFVLTRELELRYGAIWASRVYDGNREERLAFHMGADWKLR